MLALVLLAASAVARSPSVVVDVALLNLATAYLIPLVVDAVTHWSAPAWVRAAMSAGLATVSSLLAQAALNHGLLEWKAALVSVGGTILTAAVAHNGWWKPLGVTGAEGVVQNATGGKGIGAADPAGPPTAAS